MNETYQDLEGYPIPQTEAYFTPTIEDIRVGYECEIESSWGWQKGKWPEILEQDTLTGFQKEKVGALEATCVSCLRVPALTIEQIEKEGWVKREGQFQSWKPYLDKGPYSLLYHKRLEITGPNISYLGECKDINTFRYICKLLGI